MNMDRYVEKYEELMDGISLGAFALADIGEDTVLYHYTSMEGLDGMLKSKVFRATEYHYLNDEDEFTYVDQLLLEVLEEELSQKPFYRDMKASLVENMLSVRMDTEELEHSFYVVSFSKNPDNLTLWTEFASFGCNMALLPFEMFPEDTGIAYSGSVIYDRKEQKELIRQAVYTVLSHFAEQQYEEEQEIRLLAQPILRLVTYYGMAMKDERYRAEEEYRLVFEARDKNVDFRQKGGMMIPYIELPLRMEDDFPALRAVTLAPLNKTFLHKKAMNQFLSHRLNRNIQVDTSELKLRY